MDLRQLYSFACLYEERSVTRAALRLNIVQPALSMQIAKLEEEIGQKLFDRSSQGMIPTPAGHTMHRLFMPILRDFSHARQQMANLAGEVCGQVAAGFIASVTTSVLQESLADFTTQYPDVQVMVAEGYTTDIIDWVRSGQLDLAIVNRPRDRIDLSADHILEEKLVFVARASTGIAAPSPLCLTQLDRLKLVLPSKRHGLRALLDGYAESEGIVLQPQLEVDALGVIIGLVARTDWTSILPSIAVYRGVSDGSLRAHPIVSPRMVRNIICVHHPRRPITPAGRKLVNILGSNLVAAAKGFAF